MAKKSKKKVRRLASDIILVCLVAIFLVSGYNIYKIVKDYQKDQSAYSDVTRAAKAEEWTGDVDFDALKKINSEVIAWVYLKDSKINYPIVQTDNNEEYLHILFDGTYGGAGTLFADCMTEDAFSQFNTIVYGHHMRDGSMFNNLKKFKDSSYVDDHPQFEIILPDGKYHMLVWAFLNQPADSDLYTNNVDADEADKYLDWIEKHAEYVTDVKVDADDRIVALSTCAYEYDDARYVVVGKLVPWEDK